MALIKKVVGQRSLRSMPPAERQRLMEEVLRRVHGIDINPLSVLSARVSYFLAIHQLGDVQGVEIPIYLGDSAIIPGQCEVEGIPCYTYSIDNLKGTPLEVTLPQRMVRERDFGKNMRTLQSLVRAEQPDVVANALLQHLTPEEGRAASLRQRIHALAEALVSLHANKWDGIWMRIVTNFMMVARQRDCDLIVGNPPWVKWEHLPAAYARKIRRFCDTRNIFCKDGGIFGGAQLNICALIANVTAANWLTPNGVLAFLMPDSLMSQNSYEEFRNFRLDGDRRLFLQALDRWQAPLRPFRVGRSAVSQDFNTYFYGARPVDYAQGVPGRASARHLAPQQPCRRHHQPVHLL